jgi:hypothetical protein
MREIRSDKGFGDIVQAGKSDVLRAIAQGTQRSFHGGVAEHSFQSFANGGENHARTSGFRARGGRAFADLSENLRGGITRNHWDRNDAAARGFHFFTSDDLISGPVAAFDQHIRKETRDDLARRGLIKDYYRIDAFERGENFGSLALRQDRTPGAFQLADTGIAVEADDEGVAKSTSLLKAADVPGMQQIEAAIGEDNAAAVAFLAAKPQNRLLKSQNLRVQRDSMNAGAKIALALDEKLVYHAPRAQRLGAGHPS